MRIFASCFSYQKIYKLRVDLLRPIWYNKEENRICRIGVTIYTENGV